MFYSPTSCGVWTLGRRARWKMSLHWKAASFEPQLLTGAALSIVWAWDVLCVDTHTTVATTPAVMYAGILTPLSFDEYIKSQRTASKATGHIDLCPHQDILSGINCLTAEAVMYSNMKLVTHPQRSVLEHINTYSEYAHFKWALRWELHFHKIGW